MTCTGSCSSHVSQADPTGKFLVPEERWCTVRFMKDVIKGSKNVGTIDTQLIRMKDLKSINVPKNEDYRIEDEYAAAIARIPEMKSYFPHYDERRYVPQRQYFWEVYHTLDPDTVDKIVDRLNAEPRRKQPEDQNVITLRKDLLEEIEQSEH